ERSPRVACLKLVLGQLIEEIRLVRLLRRGGFQQPQVPFDLLAVAYRAGLVAIVIDAHAVGVDVLQPGWIAGVADDLVNAPDKANARQARRQATFVLLDHGRFSPAVIATGVVVADEERIAAGPARRAGLLHQIA